MRYRHSVFRQFSITKLDLLFCDDVTLIDDNGRGKASGPGDFELLAVLRPAPSLNSLKIVLYSLPQYLESSQHVRHGYRLGRCTWILWPEDEHTSSN